jgi:hypothetical protein
MLPHTAPFAVVVCLLGKTSGSISNHTHLFPVAPMAIQSLLIRIAGIQMPAGMVAMPMTLVMALLQLALAAPMGHHTAIQGYTPMLAHTLEIPIGLKRPPGHRIPPWENIRLLAPSKETILSLKLPLAPRLIRGDRCQEWPLNNPMSLNLSRTLDQSKHRITPASASAQARTNNQWTRASPSLENACGAIMNAPIV